jgi:hypothetical protein
MADDSSAAMLHSNGGVSLNGNPAPASSALFPDDMVQTQKGSVAKLDAAGSTVTIQPETVVQFEGDELNLEHGTLLVTTSTALKVRIGCLTIIPVNAGWTEYNVTDVDGRVTVFAQKSDVNINARSSSPRQVKKTENSDRAIVHQGEQKTRDERCGAGAESPVHANGAILNSPYVKWPAVGVVIGVTCWVLCRTDEPMSPSHP